MQVGQQIADNPAPDANVSALSRMPERGTHFTPLEFDDELAPAADLTETGRPRAARPG